MTGTHTDPRPAYRTALTWAHGLIAGAPPERLAAPTPCGEWDTRTLIGHLVATVRRVTVIGEGADPWSVPSVITGVPDTAWADTFAEAGEKLWTVWADDDLLDTEVRVPWGEVTGQEALLGYLNEALVHGWDLAVATGQPSEADPAVAELAMAGAQPKLPKGQRGGAIPFGDAVDPASGAGPTERLANWSGHHR